MLRCTFLCNLNGASPQLPPRSLPSHRPSHRCLQDAVYDSEAEVTLTAAVRGHLLMQLQATAAAQGWSGAPAELQRLLQPLAWMADGVDRGDDTTLVALAVVACSQVRLVPSASAAGNAAALDCPESAALAATMLGHDMP